MRENIWKPLGIERISFWPSRNPAMEEVRASLSVRDPETGRVVPHTGPFINDGAKEALGGQGASADLTEYLKILHSILVDDEVLLKKQTTAQMFQPQLTAESKDGLAKLLRSEYGAAFVGEFPFDVDYDWGLGGILVEADNAGRRKKGTLIWSGLPNLFWVSAILSRLAKLLLTTLNSSSIVKPVCAGSLALR